MIHLSKLQPWKADAEAPSPNQNVRASDQVLGVVLHATADKGNEAGSVAWMRNPKAEASAHLVIHRDGRTTRLVPDRRRAWHAGRSSWRGNTDPNSITLGWELANRNDGEPYTDAQYARTAELAAFYIRQGLTLDDFVSHAAIALPKGRKTDPLGWDWPRFRRETEELLAPQEPREPEISEPHPGDNDPPLVLEPIRIPRAEHFEMAARRLGIPGEVLCAGGAAVEAVLRAVAAGQEGPRAALAGELLGALGAYRRGRCTG